MPCKDRERQREYDKTRREYHKLRMRKNRENPTFREKENQQKREYHKAHRIEERIIAVENYYKRREREPWFSHYSNARTRCTNPNVRQYRWYGARGIKFRLTQDDVRFLWERDGACDMGKPSIDRINPNGDYMLLNCRFIEQAENLARVYDKT